MVSRRDSLQKLDAQLKSLAQKVPEGADLFAILLGLADSVPVESSFDRTAAITAASFLDHALRKAICAHLRLDHLRKETKELFNGDRGPLGTLSSMIIMAMALDIINKDAAEDLDTIRIVRNNFAHSMNHIEFNNEEVSNLCGTFNVFNKASPSTLQYIEALEAFSSQARQKFTLCVGHYFWKLFTYHPDGHFLRPSIDR